LRLGGGLQLDTPFGLFRVPNISPHPSDGSHAKRGFTQWATLLPVFPVHVVCAYENS
jgi:hypothetical protein